MAKGQDYLHLLDCFTASWLTQSFIALFNGVLMKRKQSLVMLLKG